MIQKNGANLRKFLNTAIKKCQKPQPSTFFNILNKFFRLIVNQQSQSHTVTIHPPLTFRENPHVFQPATVLSSCNSFAGIRRDKRPEQTLKRVFKISSLPGMWARCPERGAANSCQPSETLVDIKTAYRARVIT